MNDTEAGQASEKVGTSKCAGGCHCGAVRFEADIDWSKGAGRCNCSICTKIAQTGAIVKPTAFRLLTGEESLSSYEWAAKISRRFFCKHCGVHCFGRGHLEGIGGDYVSVNVNCLEGVELVDVKVVYWDGRHDNWGAGPRNTPWPIAPLASEWGVLQAIYLGFRACTGCTSGRFGRSEVRDRGPSAPA